MIINKKMKHSLVCLTLLGTIVLPACSSKEASTTTSPAATSDSTAKSTDTPKQEAPTDISIEVINYADTFVDENNPLWKEIEKRTNTKLKINWLSANTYDDKINVLLASGDLPDLTYVDDSNTKQPRELISQGVFWDLTPFIKDYPNLNRPEMKDAWANTKVNGKNYSVPRYFPTAGGGVFPQLRQDWLDQLGLKVPENMDEFFNVLKKFKEADPAGGGKTVPFSTSADYIVWVNGIFNETQGVWKLKEDGKLYATMTQPGSREGLLWIKKAYDAGLFPQDFAILKLTQIMDLVKSGNSGGFAVSMAQSWINTEPIRKTNPKAEVLPLPYLASPNGVKFAPSNSGFYGEFFIPKKVPEAKVKKILEFLNWGYGKEGNEMAFFGIPGVHYKEEGGKKIPTEQAAKDLVGDSNMNSLFLLVNPDMNIQSIGVPEDFYAKQKKILDGRSAVKTPKPAEGLLYSEAYNTYYPDFNKKVLDMRTKVILGHQKIEDFDALIKKVKNDPNFLKMEKEINEDYAKKMAK
ncbi:extracellular solute-binding protein [Paenibacillus sp. N1-5-1-14]|uniref:extracellular solute-binding protein n=1 Tax=Paenibacillus radicibacter TaxID=2972488 RepID=UPI0021592342|nr:extracellular solute-binding protein [Paenibacillus radicibacter]MCR8643073.1 extracellular solute-binding protein [Paenibacillus radicibacter]